MKILYICTHNRCRSILSEAITRHLASDLIEARSAGSQPAGEVHPNSLKALRAAGIDTSGLQSQSWNELESFAPDLVVTVCDSAAGESCPLWFGKALKVHWGLEDPSKLTGTEEEIDAAFRASIALISERVAALKTIATLDKSEWAAALADLGAK
ncbi:arsenate reductase ArsC [Spongiibacter marinus]|uniref:arsenate reductase ArsC n=1 Tax=Spongiibacter marinus TaxID=354246 RepID=UPI000418536C|nr:arsenate reductase ArsC [Spongiibacter marinus]